MTDATSEGRHCSWSSNSEASVAGQHHEWRHSRSSGAKHEIEDNWEEPTVDNCKENAEGENLSDMETDPFVVQWMVWRKDPEAWFGISWNPDEIDRKKEIINPANEGTTGEKIYCLSTFLLTSNCALRNGDVVEPVSPQTDLEEIQRELRAATTMQMRIAGPKYCEAPD